MLDNLGSKNWTLESRASYPWHSMTFSGHVNMSATVWRRKCRNMWNMYQISPNVPSNGSEASHRWHSPQSTSHRQPRPAKHIFHSVQMDKWTNGPSWSTLLVIAARLGIEWNCDDLWFVWICYRSWVVHGVQYILYFLDLFRFFDFAASTLYAWWQTLQRHSFRQLLATLWLPSRSHIDWRSPGRHSAGTELLTSLRIFSLHIYDHLRAVLACFGTFYHGMSWSHVVTQSATADQQLCADSCDAVRPCLGEGLIDVHWKASDKKSFAWRRWPFRHGCAANSRSDWICTARSTKKVVAVWVHSSVQWCLLSQSCCLRLCHSMWHWAS